MQQVFGSRAGQALVSWYDRRPERSNRHCLYCGALVGEGAQTAADKEHLIGRGMVPPGAFADPSAFNFHFRACRPCNQAKSALEDHVAAVTFLHSPGRAERPDVDEAARRKAKGSFDPKVKGTPVGEVRHDLKMKTGGAFTFGLVAGAQLDRHISEELAYRHVQGFFSLVTSEDPRGGDTTQLLPPGQFHILGSYPHRDWGNPELVEVGRRARALTSYLETTTADGYFRASLRAHPDDWWFWALEWNKSHRLVGWLGTEAAPSMFDNLPALEWMYPAGPEGHSRIRQQTPHDPQADVLFDFAPQWPNVNEPTQT